MDRVWIWRQHGLYLEFTNKRGRTKITRSHRCGFMYCLPPHWKYHCFRQFRKRQNHQNLAKWCLIYAKREKKSLKKILNIIPTICYLFFWIWTLWKLEFLKLWILGCNLTKKSVFHIAHLFLDCMKSIHYVIGKLKRKNSNVQILTCSKWNSLKENQVLCVNLYYDNKEPAQWPNLTLIFDLVEVHLRSLRVDLGISDGFRGCELDYKFFR